MRLPPEKNTKMSEEILMAVVEGLKEKIPVTGNIDKSNTYISYVRVRVHLTGAWHSVLIQSYGTDIRVEHFKGKPCVWISLYGSGFLTKILRQVKGAFQAGVKARIRSLEKETRRWRKDRAKGLRTRDPFHIRRDIENARNELEKIRELLGLKPPWWSAYRGP